MHDVVLDKVKNTILGTLKKVTPYDSLEKEHIQDTLTWVTSGEQIFRVGKPDNPNKHLVSYFVVFDEENKKILLVDHKKAELWLPTGGHVEIDEDPADTVIRECMEELYFTANFWCKEPIFVTQTITVGKTAGHTDVSLWYVIKGDSQIKYQYDKTEFSEIKWFHLDKIPYQRSDPHMKRFINKLMTIIY